MTREEHRVPPRPPREWSRPSSDGGRDVPSRARARSRRRRSGRENRGTAQGPLGQACGAGGRWGDGEIRPRPTGPGCGAAGRGPRAGDHPGGGAALAERSLSGDGQARGPAPEGQTEPEDQDLQGISAEGQSKHWVGQGC
jgi:hypothetical protein